MPLNPDVIYQISRSMIGKYYSGDATTARELAEWYYSDHTSLQPHTSPREMEAIARRVVLSIETGKTMNDDPALKPRAAEHGKVGLDPSNPRYEYAVLITITSGTQEFTERVEYRSDTPMTLDQITADAMGSEQMMSHYVMSPLPPLPRDEMERRAVVKVEILAATQR